MDDVASKPRSDIVDYISKTQPQPPAFQAASITVNATAKPKARKAASAATSKATVKAAKPKPVPTRVNAKGVALTCMVGRAGKTQCSNPSRHQHGKAWTCTTHHKALERGKKLELRGLATKAWTAPKSKAASA